MIDLLERGQKKTCIIFAVSVVMYVDWFSRVTLVLPLNDASCVTWSLVGHLSPQTPHVFDTGF